MSVPGRIDVILSTYERPSALGVVLASLDEQTFRDFEVVVADDGSGPATRELIERVRPQIGYSIRHVWQADEGYRLAGIRNRAVAASSSKYIVFLDGDCIVRPDFLARHARLAEPGRFVHGSRVRLSRRLTEAAEADGLPVHRWRNRRWLRARLSGDADRFSPFLRLPLGPLRRAAPRRWQGVKGCNLALARADLCAVNGFDESFAGWGYEDNDLVVRLIRSGVRRKEGRYAVPVLHLWHPERAPELTNRARFEAGLNAQHTRAERGIDRYA